MSIFSLTWRGSPCIILIMENKKRPSKKVLMAEIEAKGVDKTIVASLGRANIEALVFVKELLKD
jgi:hypothetical protein